MIGLSRKLTISPVMVYLAICYVVYNWTIYVWQPLYVVYGWIPWFLGILVVIIFLSYKRPHQLRFQVSVLVVCALLLAVLFLAWLAPAYSGWYGKRIASSFVSKLDIQLKVEKQQIQLLDSYNDIALPRNVRTVYVPLEPRQSVINKLQTRLQSQRRWKTDNNGTRAYCLNHLSDDNDNYTDLWNEINITTNGFIEITLYYESRPECLLQAQVK